jgi:saccharopine dehydrogenase-like NADP-dependent oxidoreductase
MSYVCVRGALDGISSMSRATAFATAAAASLMARGLLTKPGVHPPGTCLMPACLLVVCAQNTGVVIGEEWGMEK